MKKISLFTLICLEIGSKGLMALPVNFNYLSSGHPVLQLGGYESIQGKSQQINIDGLIGDYFTVSKRHDGNGLVGLGYYLDGQKKENYQMSYGINFFYLPKTSVTGKVIQENMFENLSYIYNVTHYPLYAVAKSQITRLFPKYPVTVNVGVGPNFMKTGYVYEHSLDDGVTLPDNIFSGKTTVAFSATAGIGVQFNDVFGKAPVECGYQFFYLGQGNFNALTNQVLNNLTTGNAYANAVMCAIKV